MNNEKIQVKLFAGFSLTPDVKEKLYKSPAFKESRILLSDKDLIEVQEKNRSFIGIYLKDDLLSFSSLQQTEEKLKEMLQSYLPSISIHDLHIEIFSKIFVL